MIKNTPKKSKAKQLVNSSLMEKWYVSYDVYTDRLQLFTPNIFEIKKNNIKKHNHGDHRIDINRKTNQAILVEIKNIFNKTSLQINNISKNDIIKFVVRSFKENCKYV